jgi:microsomal dipeptidase-like Zn-dependent dipeptidase
MCVKVADAEQCRCAPVPPTKIRTGIDKTVLRQPVQLIPRSIAVADPPLTGWADLHTHPMSNLAFGGKLFHGGPDAGSLLPAVQMPYDPECRFDARARNMDEALSDDAPTHGDNFQSRCGDAVRRGVIIAVESGHGLPQPGHRLGAPTFDAWPKWNDIDHQKMWVDWIKRAHQGGLRVLVALSHNNRTLGDVVVGGARNSAPKTAVTDDQHSSDLQVDEIKAFVLRHSDFMEVALSAADVHRIVQANKIAVVLGVEIDNIGNFNLLPPGALNFGTVAGEIQRLYSQGVRYIFPIHLADNAFGGTAIYDAKFSVATYRDTGHWWNIECAAPTDAIFFQFNTYSSNSFLSFLINTFGIKQAPPPSPTCAGHRNALGLSNPLGVFAVKEMMRRGMIIDIDHSSQKAAEDMLALAEAVPDGGYPLVSGHSGIRGPAEGFNAENSRTRAQLQRIGCLQGMFGLGTAGADAYNWARQYVDAFNEMGKPSPKCPSGSAANAGRVAFGTDANSLVETPKPPALSGRVNPVKYDTLPRSASGQRQWDYNTEGVVHYGMYRDFVADVRTAPANQGMNGVDLVDNHLMRSADAFWRMWQRIEAQKTRVP